MYKRRLLAVCQCMSRDGMFLLPPGLNLLRISERSVQSPILLFSRPSSNYCLPAQIPFETRAPTHMQMNWNCLSAKTSKSWKLRSGGLPRRTIDSFRDYVIGYNIELLVHIKTNYITSYTYSSWVNCVNLSQFSHWPVMNRLRIH